MKFTYTAKEAYDLSLFKYEEKLEENKKALDLAIQLAIDKGEFSTIYSRYLNDDTKNLLIQAGYKVTEKIISDEKKIWVISWEDVEPAEEESQV